MEPTIGGFIEFITNVMDPPSASHIDLSMPQIQYSFDFALNWVNQQLSCVPQIASNGWTLYALAVYNLAADTLIAWAIDAPGAPVYKDDLPYWQWLRQKYNTLAFVPGIVQSTSDEATSSSYLLPEGYSNYTIANIQNTKTPYGRQYLSIAQSWGTQWTLV